MGDTQYKSIAGDVSIKSEAKGEVEAVFARLNVVDHDGDVTIPGAFKEGQTVAISQHGHTIWDGTAPVGKGTIHTVGEKAIFRGKFFMDMAAARDTFHAVNLMHGLDELDESGLALAQRDFAFGVARHNLPKQRNLPHT